MKSEHVSSALKGRLTALETAIVPAAPGRTSIAIAKKRVDCLTDLWGGTFCG